MMPLGVYKYSDAARKAYTRACRAQSDSDDTQPKKRYCNCKNSKCLKM
jgi:hypothetical protein